MGPAGGRGAGLPVWSPAAAAAPVHSGSRSDFSDRRADGLAVLGIWNLFRGLPAGGTFGHGHRRSCLGKNRGPAAASGFSENLANNWVNLEVFAASRQKNFEIFENFDCICEKMGYNKME